MRPFLPLFLVLNGLAFLNVACQEEEAPPGPIHAQPGGNEAGDDDTSVVDDDSTPVTDDDSTPPPGDDDTSPPYSGPLGWIGSPCASVSDCPYEGAVCITDGYPEGMCAQACSGSCPDAEGYPVTFCVDDTWLSGTAATLGDGTCHSRCDFSIFPGAGCREGYGCVPVTRASESWTQTYSCLPNQATALPQCYLDLAARGVGFEPTIIADTHPEDHPELTCHVENALYLTTPVLGVDLRYYYNEEPDRVTISCEGGHAIADTANDLYPYGVVELVHVGTYGCRTISGSSSLSQHGLGNALDINGFIFDDGTYIQVYYHWEDGDSSPESWEGQFLYDAVHRWYDGWYWNIILTPEYNSDHDNHFHVDMTEGSHSLHFTGEDGPYLGTFDGVE